MTQAARFRELLRHDGMIVAPGAYDCITARMIARQVRVRRQSANAERVRVDRVCECSPLSPLSGFIISPVSLTEL